MVFLISSDMYFLGQTITPLLGSVFKSLLKFDSLNMYLS